MLGGCRADVRPMPSCYSRGCLASRNTQTSHEKIHTGSVGFEGRTCSANRAAACGQASPTPSMMAFLGFEVPHRCYHTAQEHAHSPPADLIMTAPPTFPFRSFDMDMFRVSAQKCHSLWESWEVSDPLPGSSGASRGRLKGFQTAPACRGLPITGRTGTGTAWHGSSSPRHGSPREAAERSSDKANKGLLAQAECFGIGCFGLGSCPSHLSGSSRRARAAASFAKDT